MSAQIELLDSDGVVVGSQQSSGIFVPVEIIQSLEAGTYFLSVTGGIDPAFGTTFGDYAVSVDLGSVIPPDPTDDHVDELGPDATEIDLVPQGNGQFVGSYLGNLEEAGDVDFFQFTLDTDNSNLVSSFSFDFQGLRLSLYSEDGTLLQSAETPTPFSNAQLETELLTAGTYFLSVEAVDAISTGLYVVDVLVGEFSDPDPTDDHVDEVGPDATVVELFGDSRLTGEGSGVLEAAGDIDVFQFAVESDGPVDVFSLSLGLPGSISIRLLDASGVVLQSGETQATGGVISFQEDITAGTYFISVTSLDPAVMGVPYFFTLGFGENVVVDDHVDSIGDDATEIEFIADNARWGGFQSGVLEDSTDIDVFQFRVDAASTAHIQTFQFLLSSATITLTDSDGGVLGEAATAMFFETGTIDIDLEVGTYYLIVSSDDGSSGDYFIDVTLGERANSKNVDHQAWFSTENPIL